MSYLLVTLAMGRQQPKSAIMAALSVQYLNGAVTNTRQGFPVASAALAGCGARSRFHLAPEELSAFKQFAILNQCDWGGSSNATKL